MSNCFQEFILKGCARVVVRRPILVLFIVTFFSVGSLIVSLTFYPLPSFADPNLGFETRGSELSKRLVSFENILDSLASPSSATPDHPILSKTTRGRVRRSVKNSRNTSLNFCLQPSVEYSQVIMSGNDLWTLSSVQAMCLIESRLSKSEHYDSLCEKRSELSGCCPMWSLPNYIAFLNNKTSCHNLTKEDVLRTKELVDVCRQYFFLDGIDQPVFHPKRTPAHCKRRKILYNIIFYLLDSHYQSSIDILENVLVVLPIARSSAVLPYYRSLSLPSFRLSNVSISAVNFGVRDQLFNEILLQDSLLLLGGILLVSVCFYLYTSSVFLTAMTLVSLLYSMSLAYFIYTVILRFTFFPFVNLLSSVVVIGVGGDASLILYKVWQIENLAQSYLGNSKRNVLPLQQLTLVEKRKNKMSVVKAVYRSSALSLILTSFTTAAAFFSSYVSRITSIACFGVFSGCVVLSNLIVSWWWIPSCLMLQLPNSHRFTVTYQLGKLILKPRKFWLILFAGVTFSAAAVIYHHNGLPMPDQPSLQLFLPSNPVEKFHLYSQRFWVFQLRSKSDVITLRWVWGVEIADSGDYLDPGNRGSIHLDKSFNLSHEDTQLFLYNFCRNIRREDWYGGGAGVVGARCLPETIAGWMSRRCTLFDDPPCCGWPSIPPYPPDIFLECAVRAAANIQNSLLAHPTAGVYFLHPDFEPNVRVLIVEFDSNQVFTASHEEMESFYMKLEKWTEDQMFYAPHSSSKGWFISDLALLDLQSSLHSDTAFSVLTAALLVLILITAATRDVRLAAAAVLSVSGSTLSVAAILILLGWRLDVLESSTASLAVGLAVDFTIHYALHYKSSKKDARETLDDVGGPTLVCMITSCLAAVVMLPSQILPYRRLSVFLLVLMPTSWLYATLFFLSLLKQPSSKGVT